MFLEKNERFLMIFHCGKHAHRQKKAKRRFIDFSIFSRFLRRQMKSDMVGMPNQVYILNKGCVRLHSEVF